MELSNLQLAVDFTKVQWDEATDYPALITVEVGGVKCGCCRYRHANVDTVKACYLEREQARWETAGELYAEEGLVRMLENQGSCSGIVNYSDPQGGPCLCC